MILRLVKFIKQKLIYLTYPRKEANKFIQTYIQNRNQTSGYIGYIGYSYYIYVN